MVKVDRGENDGGLDPFFVVQMLLQVRGAPNCKRAFSPWLCQGWHVLHPMATTDSVLATTRAKGVRPWFRRKNAMAHGGFQL
jgi:hypothetical protein